MNAHDALKLTIGTGQFVCSAYLEDLSDAELMRRAAPGINHINWQLGHLILSEHSHISDMLPGSMPALPPGFAEKYSKAASASDRPEDFCDKATLMRTFHEQRAATLAAMATVSAEDFDRPAPPQYLEYAPTWGALFELQGSHWLMHCGQWAVVRRQLGRPALF